MSQETLIGAVERITFYSLDSGYGVIKISPDGKPLREAIDREGFVTVVGIMPELIEGESVRFVGTWVNNAQYGQQFKAEMCVPMPPQSERGVIRYLMDTVFGVGESTAKRIYAHFGTETMAVLDTSPERVGEVAGIKPKIVENVMEAFGKERALRQVMIQLQDYGVSSYLAKRIFEEYGTESLGIIKNDPYILADDLRGVGFKRADTIARSVGFEINSPQRLRAGLSYTLSQMSQEGHVFVPRDVLVQSAEELLEASDTVTLSRMLSEQVLAGNLYSDAVKIGETNVEAIYLPIFYKSEAGCAKRLRAISETPSKILLKGEKENWEKTLAKLVEQANVTLSAQQQSAVKAAFMSKVSVLTGGPGTGKTTTLQMVIHALEAHNFSYALASPTGRASKRLAEATERTASTIHRLLEFTPNAWGFARNEDNPLEVDMLIIDESSMLDLTLFYSVLKALHPTTHLVLVGDVDQLPSVGAGNVLKDVIESSIGHVTRLHQIFRQDNKSYITQNAHRINQGEMPYLDNQSDDFFFFNVPSQEDTAQMIVDVVKNRIPQKFGFHPLDDIQVIAPMYRGTAGVEALNIALQRELNGDFRLAEVRIGGRIFRKNDKVMQTKNNYEKEVFNGDIGKIHTIDIVNQQLVVLSDGREVEYEFKEAEEQLIHAYCITTHRSQGSEYPVVVMPIVTQHYLMLQRNLLYTAITRAKKLAVLVGDKRAVAMAVNNNKVSERYSGLIGRIQKIQKNLKFDSL